MVSSAPHRPAAHLGFPGVALVVEFFAAGRAVSQPRPADGKGHRIMAPAKHAIRGWRERIRAAGQRAMNGRAPAVGPVRFVALFRFKRPKRLCFARDTPTHKMLTSSERYEDEFVRHESDPDWDNIGKAVSDSLKGVAWFDDCQVWSAHVEKVYCGLGEEPGVHVSVYRDA